jgi:hypothetical protein
MKATIALIGLLPFAIWFKIKPAAKGEHAAPAIRTEPVAA